MLVGEVRVSVGVVVGNYFLTFKCAYDHPWVILIQNMYIYGAEVSALSFLRDRQTDRRGSFYARNYLKSALTLLAG